MTRGRRSAKERPSLAPAAAIARAGRRRGIEAPDSPKDFCELGTFARGCGRRIVIRVGTVGLCDRHRDRLAAIALAAGAL